MKHFLHPKLLRKAREVRSQLEDIMKMQKMEVISAGTDYDVLRFAFLFYVMPSRFLNCNDFNIAQKSHLCWLLPPSSEGEGHWRVRQHTFGVSLNS